MADAGDIITVTVGEGLGVTAKAGPIHTGLGYCFDYYGLRCGEILKRNRGAWDFGEYKSGDFALVILAVSGFWSNECNNLPKRAEVRGKTFESEWLNWQGNGHFVPFFDVPSGHHGKGCPSQLTQMDIAIGVGISIRLGINPLELVDFILGFVGLDIYDDDVAGAKGEEKERQ